MLSRYYQPLCLAALASVCGCGQTDSPEAIAAPEFQATVSGASELSIVVSDSPAETLTEPESAPIDQEPVEQKTAATYQPPYPDRVELFLAPKRDGRRSTRNEQEDAVELLGFVNVDHQRAVLMINGSVYPVAVGDSQFGVEVISIQPPAVVLQRGRQRWQATLEN